MNKTIKRGAQIVSATLLLSPLAAFAAGGASNLGGLLNMVNSIVQFLIPMVIALGVLYFLWSVFSYIGAGDDEEKRKAARGKMIYGVIAIFVMVSLWGLVNFIGGTLGLDSTAQAGPSYTVPSIAI